MVVALLLKYPMGIETFCELILEQTKGAFEIPYGN